MTLYSYAVTIKREGRHYYAYSDVFPGVYGIGKTIEAARGSILEAMRLCIERCRKNHEPVPASRHVYAENVTLVME
jgi:predicted RNase H-like HicB family nuclease